MAAELIMEVMYQLQMLGVPLARPATMLGDNLSIVINTSVPVIKEETPSDILSLDMRRA